MKLPFRSAEVPVPSSWMTIVAINGSPDSSEIVPLMEKLGVDWAKRMELPIVTSMKIGIKINRTVVNWMIGILNRNKDIFITQYLQHYGKNTIELPQFFFKGSNKYSRPFTRISYIVSNHIPNLPFGKPFLLNQIK